MAWALWGALAWSISLSDKAAKAVSLMEDDIVALLALDLETHGPFPVGTLDKKAWSDIVSKQTCFSRNTGFLLTKRIITTGLPRQQSLHTLLFRNVQGWSELL